MITKVVLAASFGIYAFQHITRKSAAKGNTNANEDNKEVYSYDDNESTPKEEEEEVKRVSFIDNPPSNQKSFSDIEDVLLPEIEQFLSESYQFVTEKGEDLNATGIEKETLARTRESKSIELQRLRNVVEELENREVKLEGELLEYYGMKEQANSIAELQRQLQIRTVEIDMLRLKIQSLESQKKNLEIEVSELEMTKKELDSAKIKINDLQKQMQTDSSLTKEQLLKLKQQVLLLQAKEKEAAKKDFEIEKKLQNLKELDVEVMDLRRSNKELQQEKRELTVKLEGANAQITTFSRITESDIVAQAKEEVNTLKHTNADLLKQVEGLQIGRFSEVEELVYLRWVNACLRYELRNYQAPPGKVAAKDLNKSLSPKSQEKAKQLMVEYAAPDLMSVRDTEFESISSQPSTPSEYDYYDNVSVDSSSSRYSTTSKKSSIIKKLTRWGRNKDDNAGSFYSDERGEFSSSGRIKPKMSFSKGSLESLIMRNASDKVAITTFGRGDQAVSMGRTMSSSSLDSHDTMQSSFASPDRASLPRIRTKANEKDSSLNNVAASFQLMSKSAGSEVDEKYPPFKERHKLASEREKTIKEKAEQARTKKLLEKREKFRGSNSLDRHVFVPQVPMGKSEQALSQPIKPLNSSGKLSGNNLACNGNSENRSDENLEQQKETEIPVVNKMKLAEVQKRPPRVAKPPPKPSTAAVGGPIAKTSGGVPMPPPLPPCLPGAPGAPPPPPPPPGGLPKSQGLAGDKVHRAPELVEFYQSLMKREAKKETGSATAASDVVDARNNMIGEMANRSAFLLSVKADVETQGDFVESLATEVRAAAYANIEDLVSFVNWLDEELSFLVDERAVLKHFDWPESKADAMREAAFEYQDLKKLASEITLFEDHPKLSCEAALKKMYSLLEKVEQSVYALLRTRDMAVARYKEFSIPTDWLLDTGVVGKIKLASVQLARKYMKRVTSELEAIANVPEKEPFREFLILQGVRFAFRVHQFAGGFDMESMRAFEELRNRARAQAEEKNKALSEKSDSSKYEL